MPNVPNAQDALAVVLLQLTGRKKTCWDDKSEELEFFAQYDTTIPEEKRFSDATPNGHLLLYVNNPEVLKALELGKKYYFFVVPAET